MLEGLRKLKKTLDELKIEYVLDCGTLLFAIRENRSDPNDVDVSIFERDKHKLISGLETFIKNGFRFNNLFFHPKLGLIAMSLLWKDWGVDIFVRYEKNDYSYFVALYDNDFIVAGHPKKFFKKLDTFEFDGMSHKVPHNPEDYLTAYYGDWRIVIEHDQWDRCNGPKCIHNELL